MGSGLSLVRSDRPTVAGCQNPRGWSEGRWERGRSKRLLEVITDNMTHGLIATDCDGVVTLVSRAAERMLGWAADDLVGRSGHLAFHCARPDGSPYPVEECALCNACKVGTPTWGDEYVFVRRDGTEVQVNCTATPLVTEEFSGNVIVFDHAGQSAVAQTRRSETLAQMTWAHRIRDAFAEGRMVLYAQPIIDLATRQLVRHELLVRMISPSGSIVAPQRFLPAAESLGLISEIDRWVVTETARLTQEGHALSFNLSAKSVMDERMLRFVRQRFDECSVSLESTVCEITETALLYDMERAATFVRGMRDLGCDVALDDFGSGYGGFGYLKRLPVSSLKIDHEFIGDLRHELASRHVVSAIVSLARAFTLRTVAEGAEDEDTLDLLEELGVDKAQGYIIARPAPVSEVLRVAPPARSKRGSFFTIP